MKASEAREISSRFDLTLAVGRYLDYIYDEIETRANRGFTDALIDKCLNPKVFSLAKSELIEKGYQTSEFYLGENANRMEITWEK